LRSSRVMLVHLYVLSSIAAVCMILQPGTDAASSFDENEIELDKKSEVNRDVLF